MIPPMDNSHDKDRRRAFRILGSILLAGGGGFAAINYVLNREGAIDEWVTLGPVTDLPVGEVLSRTVSVTEHGMLRSRPVNKVIWLRRNPDGSLLVLTGACPHHNCTANWVPEKGLFDCRCHNSVFDPSGRVLEGPAPRSMDSLEHRIEAGILSVRYQKFRIGIPTKQVVL